MCFLTRSLWAMGQSWVVERKETLNGIRDWSPDLDWIGPLNKREIIIEKEIEVTWSLWDLHNVWSGGRENWSKRVFKRNSWWKIKEHRDYTSIKFSSCSEALSHTDARQSSWSTSLDLRYYCHVHMMSYHGLISLEITLTLEFSLLCFFICSEYPFIMYYIVHWF